MPGSTDSAVIPSGVPNWPNVNSTASVGNLTIQDGAHLDATYDVIFEVSGNWLEQGTGNFNASDGTVVFQSDRDQSIMMNSASNFNNIQIGNGSGSQTVTANSDLDVNGDLTIAQGVTFTAEANTIHLSGDWTDSGANFTAGASTVILNGGNQLVQKQNPTYTYSLGPEGFEAIFPPSGWSLYTLAGSDWAQGATGSGDRPTNPHSGFFHAWHNYYGSDQDAWLVTPQFSVPSGGATLSFWENNFWTSNWYEYHGVHISTGSCNPADGGFSELAEFSAALTDWTNRTVNLNSYAGHNVCLAFQYTGNFMDEWFIDDVDVYGFDWGGDLIFHDLTVQSSSGADFNGNVALSGDLTVDGVMDLNGNELTVDNTLTNNGSIIQTLEVSSYTEFLHVQNVAGDSDKYRGVDITPTGDMGSTTVVVRGNQAECNVGNELIARCFDIAPGTPQSATIRFWYLNSESNGENINSMGVYHWNGSTWNQLSLAPTPRGTSSPYEWVEAVNVSSYSHFGLSDGNPSVPTAVTEGDFTGEPDFSYVRVRWELIWDLDIAGFNLYRSDRINSEKELLSYIAAGPSTGHFEFTDMSVVSGEDYYYWLDVIGSDSKSKGLVGPVNVAAMYGIWLPALSILQ